MENLLGCHLGNCWDGHLESHLDSLWEGYLELSWGCHWVKHWGW